MTKPAPRAIRIGMPKTTQPRRIAVNNKRVMSSSIKKYTSNRIFARSYVPETIRATAAAEWTQRFLFLNRDTERSVGG